MCGRNWWLLGFIIGNLAGFFYWDATIWLVYSEENPPVICSGFTDLVTILSQWLLKFHSLELDFQHPFAQMCVMSLSPDLVLFTLSAVFYAEGERVTSYCIVKELARVRICMCVCARACRWGEVEGVKGGVLLIVFSDFISSPPVLALLDPIPLGYIHHHCAWQLPTP